MTRKLTEEQKQAYRKYRRDWYHRNKEYAKQKITERKQDLRDWLSELKSTLKCNRCPEKHIACLDFHHTDPSKKEEGVAKMIHDGYSKEKILEEIAKCEVLCSNCHRKEHHRGEVL